jgi:small subunit ribosomal protein S17
MGSLEKLQIGTVVSTKMDKTVVVRIDRQKRHRLYGKTLRTTHRYKAHDEGNTCNLGDIVKIAETRPLSREKRWRVVEIVQKGDVAELAPKDVASTLMEEITTAADANIAARVEAERAEREARLAAEAAAAEQAAAAEPEAAAPAPAAEAPETAASDEVPEAAAEPEAEATAADQADAEGAPETTSDEEQPS